MTERAGARVIALFGGGDLGRGRLARAVEADLLERAQGGPGEKGAQIDEGRYSFGHQLLQEWFAACGIKAHIERGDVPAGRRWIEPLSDWLSARGIQVQIGRVELPASLFWRHERWWQPSGWEEAAILAAGLYSDDCWPVIDWLKQAQPEVAARCILESGAALPVTRGQPGRPDAPLAVLHDLWLPRLTDIQGDPHPEARAAVGRALALLGLDDRVIRLPTEQERERAARGPRGGSTPGAMRTSLGWASLLPNRCVSGE